MATMTDAPVHWMDNEAPEMQGAIKTAQATFRYFWREMSWEFRRIIPGLEVAAVKAPFSADGVTGMAAHGPVEHLWFSDIMFDGLSVSGVLLNSPNAFDTVTAGDAVSVPLREISDWMYAQGGRVYGAHTVNALRASMSASERASHDAAWGLDFGDPDRVLVVPAAPRKGLRGLFNKPSDPLAGEHPMCLNMIPSLKEALQADPNIATQTDERGWTMLHSDALAGNRSVLEVLLAHGADARATTHRGRTAYELAELMDWRECMALLNSAR